MNIFEKLVTIQKELKAPKGQYNSFGKFRYRSCEDILEAVKPLLSKYKCTLTLSDEIEIKGDRYYIKANALLTDTEDDKGFILNTAYAREADSKSGMDASQITGTASSYARKYALNGLFLIDDTKDADTDEHANQINADPQKEQPKEEKPISEKQKEVLRKIAKEQGEQLDENALNNMSMQQASDLISKYKGAK